MAHRQLDSDQVTVIDAEKVAGVVRGMPTDNDIVRLSEIFRLLSDPNRVRLLVSLAEAKEMCVCDLAAVTAMSESSVSHALRLMRAHRVVKVRRSGRMSYYSLSDAHVRMLLNLGLEHLRHDDG